MADIIERRTMSVQAAQRVLDAAISKATRVVLNMSIGLLGTDGQLKVAMAVAAATMTVYCIGSANLGAVVGQTHAITTRSIFGRIGSAIVSLLLVIDGMGFYLFTVIFIISLAQALLGTLPAVGLLTAALAFVM